MAANKITFSKMDPDYGDQYASRGATNIGSIERFTAAKDAFGVESVASYNATIYGAGDQPDRTAEFNVAGRWWAFGTGRYVSRKGYPTARAAHTAAKNWIRQNA